MTDRRKSDTEEFQIAPSKNSIPGVPASPQCAARTGDVLQQPFSREDAPTKTTQYSLLQLINMVRENPILYDEDLQSTIPDAQLKVQKREAWDRIRADIVWQDITLVQEVWADILDQYARKTGEMADSLSEAMRWADPLVNKKKSDSRPPSQLNTMSSALDKDFYSDVPMAEDVLESQSMGSPSSSMKFDYVVIQPTVSHSRSNNHQTNRTNSTQLTRRKSPETREIEAIVSTYPLSPKRLNPRMTNSQNVKPPQLMVNEVKKEGHSLNFGRSPVLVEVDSSYSPQNTKVYKIGPQRSTSVGNNARRIVELSHRGNSISYETLPEQYIESPSGPPKKKIAIEVPIEMRHHQTSSIVTSSASNVASIISKNRNDGSIQTMKIISDGVPIADDEIILDADGECKLGGPELLLGQQRSNSQNHEMDSNMASTSANSMHHYHHEDIEETGVVEDIGQQVVVDGQSEEMAIQYDEDLAFQQHINSVLNRLSEDDKTIMKFNMQKIILDARFGSGTARSMLKHDELIEVQAHVEIDPNEVESEQI